jgi:large subunit ribosomal protein L22
MEAYAILKNVKGSSQKVKLVVDLVRGKMVNEALALLRFSNKRAAKPVEMVLRSAIANATDLAERDNIIVDVDDLWVSEIYVGKGVTKHRRRVRPAPMGRAYRERRHYSHVTVRVSSEKREADAKKTKAGSKTAKAEAPPQGQPETQEPRG